MIEEEIERVAKAEKESKRKGREKKCSKMSLRCPLNVFQMFLFDVVNV